MVFEASRAGDVGYGNRKYPVPEIGDKFGELKVVGFKKDPDKKSNTIWVECSCGEKFAIEESRLRNCYRREGRKRLGQKVCLKCARRMHSGYVAVCPDDKHRKRLRKKMEGALNRCTNPNADQWENYGGRGIGIYEPWTNGKKGKLEFLKYLMSLPGWEDPNLQLDRCDVDGNYEPGNIRFVTPSTNCLNKRSVAEMQTRINELEQEVEELKARLRKCEKG